MGGLSQTSTVGLFGMWGLLASFIAKSSLGNTNDIQIKDKTMPGATSVQKFPRSKLPHRNPPIAHGGCRETPCAGNKSINITHLFYISRNNGAAGNILARGGFGNAAIEF